MEFHQFGKDSCGVSTSKIWYVNSRLSCNLWKGHVLISVIFDLTQFMILSFFQFPRSCLDLTQFFEDKYCLYFFKSDYNHQKQNSDLYCLYSKASIYKALRSVECGDHCDSKVSSGKVIVP